MKETRLRAWCILVSDIILQQIQLHHNNANVKKTWGKH